MPLQLPFVGKEQAKTAISLLIAVFLFLPIRALHAQSSSYGIDPYFPGYKANTTQAGSANKPAAVEESTGAFGYTLPVRLPTGRGPTSPTLSLRYSSNDRDVTENIVGQGWSFSIPSITRFATSGTTSLYRGNTFNSSLDGELVQVQSTVFAARIDQGNDHQYLFDGLRWIVKMKNGLTYTFGETSESRVTDDATSRIYRWMLTEIRDQNGNYTTYTYKKDGGQSYPDQIFYTRHQQQAGVYVVRFEYESRPVTTQTYRPGFLVSTSQRVKRVVVSISGTDRYFFSLGYTVGDNEASSLVASITESAIGTDGALTQLPPYQFSYARNQEKKYNAENYPGASANGNQVADINGDALPDLIVATKNTHPTTLIQTEVRRVYLNGLQALSDGTRLLRMSLNNSWIVPEGFLFNDDNNDRGTRLADMNGDGLPDLLSKEKGIWYNNGTSTWLNSGRSIPVAFSSTGPSYGGIYSNGTYLVDIDGNGLTDIFKNSVVYLNDGFGFTATSSWTLPTLPYSSWPRDRQSYYVQFPDINGDGLIDFVWQHAVRAFENDNGYGGNASYGNYTAVTTTQRVFINTGTTFIEAPTNTIPVYIGNGMFYPTDSESYLHANSVRFADINNDGLQDIVHEVDKGFMDTSCGRQWSGVKEAKVLFNTGSSYVTNTRFTTYIYPMHKLDFVRQGDGNCIHNYNYYLDRGVYLIDTSGDSQVDSLMSSAHGAYAGASEVGTSDTLTKITHPYGGVTNVTYSATGHDFFDSSTTRYSHHQSLPFVQRFVKTIEEVPSVGASHRTTYEYRNGFVRKDVSRPYQQAFAGFEVVKKTDAAKSVTTYYHQGNAVSSTNAELTDEFALTGQPYKIVIESSIGAVFDVTFHRYNITSLPTQPGQASRYRVQTGTSTQLVYEGGTTHRDTAQSFLYDSSGNLIEVKEFGEVTAAVDGSFTDIANDHRMTQYSYATRSNGDATNLVYRQIASGMNQNALITETEYDLLGLGLASQGNPTKETRRNEDSTLVVSTKQDYDVLGLTIMSIDPRGATTTFEYDPTRLYLQRTTNALGHTSTKEVDLLTNKAISETDANGKRARALYDGFGRVLATYGSSSSGEEVLFTSSTYRDIVTNPIIYETKFFDGGTSLMTTHYLDRMGRLVQSRTQSPTSTSQYRVVDTGYDSLGRTVSTSLPYWNTGASRTINTTLWGAKTEFVFDPKDRPVKTSQGNAHTYSFYYPFRVVVKDPRGKLKEYGYDTYNRLTSVTERNGAVSSTTSYTYNRDGKLLTYTDAAGNIRHFIYDALGRLTYASDMHALNDVLYASKSFVYDANGNLVTEKWQDNKSITHTYDALNRLITTSYNGTQQIRNTYDTCTNGIGRVCLTTGNGYQKIPSYDIIGNTIQLQTKIATTTYNETYQYDRTGRVVSSTLADGLLIQYGFTKDVLTQVTTTELGSPAKTVIKSVFYNANNQPLQIVYGNGATSTHTYDLNARYRLSALNTYMGTTTLQNYTYAYDANSNLTGLRDSSTIGKRNITYTYDDIGRMTSVYASSSTGAPLYREVYSYDVLGNLLSSAKSNGTSATTTQTYEYSQVNYANPHAATKVTTSIDGVPFGYQQMYFDTHGNTSMIYTYDATGTEQISKRFMHNYDVANRVTQQILGENTVTTYVYDPNGNRLIQNESGKITHYPTDSFNTTRDATGVTTSTQKHLSLFGKNMISVDGTGVNARVLYQHPDHLNGASVITNEAKQVEQYLEYYPFGGTRVDTKAGAWSEQRRFTGHEHDASGLIYMKARYYDPTLGRFLVSDPAFWDMSLDLKDPQAWNSFAYARNSPVVMVDPDGRAFLPSFQTGALNQGGKIVDWLSQGPGVTVKDTISGIVALPVNFVKDVYLTSNFSDGLAHASTKVSNMSSQQRIDALGSVSGALTTELAFSALTGGTVKGISSFGARSVSTQAINTRFISTQEGILDVLPTQQRIQRNQLLSYKRDGGIFENRNSVLPNAESGYYSKYVVPVPGMSKAGTVRLISGKGGEQWITLDHYKSVIPIKK